MTAPFAYPPVGHLRRHGPQSYADYGSYRPWLRDEFSFRCAYCLMRETWSRVRGVFAIEHFLPVAVHPDRVTEYDNLLYACAACYSIKGSKLTPNPLTLLTANTVRVLPDGTITADEPEGRRIIELLALNDGGELAFRQLIIDMVSLAAQYDPDLYRRLLRFPEDLPDLSRLAPPGGNSRPDGVTNSAFARKQRGELPDTY